jgi:hypothetical protein
MALRVVIALLSIAGLACADALTLRDGRVVEGTYLGGDARQVRMSAGEKIETFDLSAVAKIEFVAPLTGTAAPAAPQPAANAAGTLNGLAALIAIVAAAPNADKAPETPPNPFTTLPSGTQPKPPQPNQP